MSVRGVKSEAEKETEGEGGEEEIRRGKKSRREVGERQNRGKRDDGRGGPEHKAEDKVGRKTDSGAAGKRSRANRSLKKKKKNGQLFGMHLQNQLLLLVGRSAEDVVGR